MNDRCPCGDPIYADTEDWEIPLCYECYVKKGVTMNRLDDLKRDLPMLIKHLGTDYGWPQDIEWLIRVAEAAEYLLDHVNRDYSEWSEPLRKALEDSDE